MNTTWRCYVMAYTIVSDTSANLPEEIIEKNNITMVSLSYFINDVEYKCYEKGKKTDLKACSPSLFNSMVVHII